MTGLARGRFIGFLGPDGAGKTTIIRAVVACLEQRGTGVDRYHWRIRWSGPATSDVGPVHADPHGRASRGIVGSLLQLVWWWLTAWMSWLRHVRSALVRGRWVVIDRGPIDAVVDPRRYRNGAPAVVRRVWAMTQPGPDLWIVLTAPAEVLNARKPEVPIDVLRRLISDYRSLSGPRFVQIAVDQDVEVVVAEVRCRVGLS